LLSDFGAGTWRIIVSVEHAANQGDLALPANTAKPQITNA
jgi:hypothetical protein